jgi:hypothetical protein
MRKSGKNDDMIRNKIATLNKKPPLRATLFKQEGLKQIQKDLEEKKKDINDFFQILGSI